MHVGPDYQQLTLETFRSTPKLDSRASRHAFAPMRKATEVGGLLSSHSKLSLQDLTNLWEALKPTLSLTVAYVARMVALDSDVEMAGAPLVQSRGFDAGKGPLL